MRKAVIAAAVTLLTLIAAVYLRLMAVDIAHEAQHVPVPLKQDAHQLSDSATAKEVISQIARTVGRINDGKVSLNP